LKLRWAAAAVSKVWAAAAVSKVAIQLPNSNGLEALGSGGGLEGSGVVMVEGVQYHHLLISHSEFGL
jgi:hypothetical protein